MRTPKISFGYFTEIKSFGGDATRDLLLLSLTAGSADAIGYLGLGQVFTSNMTGNLVLLGINLGQGDFVEVGRILYVVALFVIGACLGAWLSRDVPEKEWPTLGFRLIGLEKIALLFFAIGWVLHVYIPTYVDTHVLLALLAVAMGLQAAAMARNSAPGVATTAITGTLTALATGTINLFFLSKAPLDEKIKQRNRVWFQFGAVLLYCVGAAIAGSLVVYLPHWAGCFPLIASLFVALSWPRKL